MNPTLNNCQSLLINSSTNDASLQILQDSCEEYMIAKNDACAIIEEVRQGVRQWETLAISLGISKRERNMFAQVYNKTI